MSITAHFKIGEEKFNDGVDRYVIGIVLFELNLYYFLLPLICLGNFLHLRMAVLPFCPVKNPTSCPQCCRHHTYCT